jgi:hypothetical protein
MTKGRLEAFSDGVVAIIITIMVLELKVPHGEDLESLRPLAHDFLAYVLSFLYVGIYWNNHHHLLHAAHHVDGRILWTNLHLLFWLSLFPFANHWIGETDFAAMPIVAYGGVLLMAGSPIGAGERALGAPRPGLGARARDRPRRQGQPLARELRARHRGGGARLPLARVRDLLRRGARLVHPRPAHRARARGAQGAVSRPRFTNTRPEVHAHEARTLPARYYNDASLFEDELRLIHQRMWLHAGRPSRSTDRGATSWCASPA